MTVAVVTGRAVKREIMLALIGGVVSAMAAWYVRQYLNERGQATQAAQVTRATQGGGYGAT